MSDEIKETQTGDGAGGAESEALYDSGAIADAFLAGEESGDDVGNSEGGDAAQDGAQGTDAGAAAQEGSDAQEGAEQPAPPMPEGWEDAMWQGLAPDVKAKIAERVNAHAAELSALTQSMQKARAAQEQFTVQANAQLQQALATMQQIVEGEFRQVDWQGLASSDPASYVQLQRMYSDRMGAIRQIQQGIAQQVQAVQQARQQEEAQRMRGEFDAVLPRVRAMVGAEFDGKKFAGELAAYMVKSGVPAEAVNSLSRGYELEMAAKAMMFDKLAASRAAAAKKVADAPKVQGASASRGDEGRARYRKAMEVLKANPNSTDAIASVFETL